MVFGEVCERFVQSSPACVMHRALLEHVFAPARLDALFGEVAEKQYPRELLFSTLVELMGQVVCRSSKSAPAAYVRQRERISVSIRSVYGKLSHVEVGTSRALVQHTAGRVRELVDRLKGGCTPLLQGYRVRILDGNHLGKTQHRLKVLRGTAAGALPGQALVLLDPPRWIIEDIIPCEDGHTQERALLEQVLPSMEKGDLIIDDRNFCTRGFLFALKQRRACFITRQHGRMPWKSVGTACYVGRCETGRSYEQAAEPCDPETGNATQLRRITGRLKASTRDGDREIHLLTNLPNKVQAVKGALRGTHGQQTVEYKVSNYFLTDEINSIYGGMMVALPPADGTPFQKMSRATFAAHLRGWARGADLANDPKHPRGPKQPQARRPNAQFQHVSTAKLLEEQRLQRSRQPQSTLHSRP